MPFTLKNINNKIQIKIHNTRLFVYSLILFVIFAIFLSFDNLVSDPLIPYYDSIPLKYTIHFDETDTPKVIFNWYKDSTSIRYNIKKKNVDEVNFGFTYKVLPSDSNFLIETLPKGEIIEYGIEDYRIKFSSYAYCAVGLEIPLTDKRGTVLVLVDSTIVDSLSFELERLKIDLIGDGWKTEFIIVPRAETFDSDKVQFVKEIINSKYEELSEELVSLLLIGKVPVPYSGHFTVDGHRDHIGAWPADAYYGIFSEQWTDTATSDSSRYERNHNYPNDGKFDQYRIPDDVKLQIGRIDLYNLTDFQETEIELLRNYLNKNHNFRNAFYDLPDSVIIYNTFQDTTYHDAPPANGYMNFYAMFGQDYVVNEHLRKAIKERPFLWAYGTGPGSSNSVYDIAYTNEYATDEQKAFFYALYGSYNADWDGENNILRATIASSPYGLICIWSGRPYWQLQHLNLGKTFGYVTKLSQNITANTYQSVGYIGYRFVHISLMGDATLRMNYPKPIKNLEVTPIQEEFPVLSWSYEPSDEFIGFNVYRSNSIDGNFEKINTFPFITNHFIDGKPLLGKNVYQVRAVNLTKTYSGSYYNQSTGLFVETNYRPPINTEMDLDFTIAPNPIEKDFRIFINSLEEQYITIKIHSVDGKLLAKIPSQYLHLGVNVLYLDLSLFNISPGSYYFSIENKSNVKVKKIIKI